MTRLRPVLLWPLLAVASLRPSGLRAQDDTRGEDVVRAHALGLDEDLGTIEVGKLADLVILTANPLDDLRNSPEIDRIMMNGRLFDAGTLDEVWPRQRAVGPFYWHADVAEPRTSAGIHP